MDQKVSTIGKEPTCNVKNALNLNAVLRFKLNDC